MTVFCKAKCLYNEDGKCELVARNSYILVSDDGHCLDFEPARPHQIQPSQQVVNA